MLASNRYYPPMNTVYQSYLGANYYSYQMLHGNGTYDIRFDTLNSTIVFKVNTILPSHLVTVSGVSTSGTRLFHADYSLDGSSWTTFIASTASSTASGTFNANRNNIFYVRFVSDDNNAKYLLTNGDLIIKSNIDLSGCVFCGNRMESYNGVTVVGETAIASSIIDASNVANAYSVLSTHPMNKPVTTRVDGLGTSITGYDSLGGFTYIQNTTSTPIPLLTNPWSVYFECIPLNLGLEYMIINFGGSYFRISVSNSSGLLKLQFRNAAGTWVGTDIQQTSFWDFGNVNKVLVDFDGTDLHIYKNGTLIKTSSSPSLYTSAVPAGYYLLSDSNLTRVVNGTISKPIVFNRVLSTEERDAIFSSKMNVAPDLSEGWLQLDGGYAPEGLTMPVVMPVDLGSEETQLYTTSF